MRRRPKPGGAEPGGCRFRRRTLPRRQGRRRRRRRRSRPEPAREATLTIPAVNTALGLAPADSLWRISRRVYGAGVRYTVIFDANQEQIRDPNLIFPGQIFVLPGEAALEDAAER